MANPAKVVQDNEDFNKNLGPTGTPLEFLHDSSQSADYNLPGGTGAYTRTV